MTTTNDDLGRIFHEIGDILEVKGEIPFKTIAYHRAADAIAKAPFDVATAYAALSRGETINAAWLIWRRQ